VAYSVMVWLVDPGEQAHQEQAMQRTTTGRAQAPGAASDVDRAGVLTLWTPALSLLALIHRSA
jgi:hypothetical protein